MTINSDWLKIVKEGCPDAFSRHHPHPLGTVFIDGQIRLMKPDYIRTWDLFVQKQFLDAIDRWFAQGALVVVLGFDDYEHVPASKHMTQRKRSQHVPVMNFDAHADLPPAIPQDWSAAMRNRSFKNKVVSLVSAYVRNHYKNRTDAAVVIDHTRAPEGLGRPWQLPLELTSQDGQAPAGRGECDIKGPAYMRNGSGQPTTTPLTLSSTDGDFLPIALLQIEQMQQTGETAPEVVLYRMRTSLPSDGDSVKNQKYEFLHVQKVYDWLKKQFPRKTRPAAHFASLVAACGCDFAQNLPQLGPIRVWKIRNRFDCIDTHSAHGILATIYLAYLYLFQNKITLSSQATALSSHATAGEALSELVIKFDQLTSAVKRNTLVAARTKESLWSAERALAHAQNSYWTTLYWSMLHRCPCPLSGDFGFHRVNGVVDFEGQSKETSAKKAANPKISRARPQKLFNRQAKKRKAQPDSRTVHQHQPA